MKYLKKHKILLLISIVLVIVTSMFLVLNNSHAYKELPQVKIKGDVNKSGLAIMIEKDYQTGEYQQSNSTTFPTDGYTLNRIKSGCVDKNGKDVDALTYNENDKTISIKTKQSVYCYLYYDNLFKGLGTEDEPYQINYIEDLVRLSNSVNKDLNTYQSKNFILTRDLDFNENDSYMKYNDTGFGDINGVNNIEGIKDELTNKEGSGFISIGNLTTHFQGNFNGNNKRLDNLYILNKTDGNYLVGLFGSVENSLMKNITISGNINTKVATRVGGLIGFSYGNTTIDNCINEVNGDNAVKGNSVGGFVGDVNNNLKIINSVNKGNMSGGNNTGGFVGYIADDTTLTIEDCYNEGAINNRVGNFVGGFLGRDVAATSKTIIKNSYNAGEITSYSSLEGGLVGNIYGTLEVYNSHNEGKISNNMGYYVGGLLGYGDTTSNITITNSYNSNDVTINPTYDHNRYIGGLIGVSYGKVNITGSYNNGDVISEKEKYSAWYNSGTVVGGLIGGLYNSVGDTIYITNSHNSGNVLNGTTLGGLIGLNTQNHITIIDRSYNTGKVFTNLDFSQVSGFTGTIAAGLIGQSSIKTKVFVLNSYNTGEINLSEFKGQAVDVSGLIIGSYESVNTILNSYNMGTVKSVNRVAGIYENTHTTDYVKINNVYNSGEVTGNDIKYNLSYMVHPYEMNNAYYLSGNNLEGSNVGETTPMTEVEMKNTTFVDTLNKNVDELNNVGLETIDENLKDYTLDKWIQGSDDYPILIKKIEDLSGHGNHGISYALKYDSNGVTTSTDNTHRGYINAGLSDYDFGNSFSLTVKLKFNTIPNDIHNNYLIGNWEAGGIGMYITYSDEGYIFTDAICTDKYYSFTKSYNFNTTDWYTLILTYDGNLEKDNLKVYINGELFDSVNVTGNIKKPSNKEPIIIGANPTGDTMNWNSYAYATYKEALVFDRALTEEQDHISTNYKDDIDVKNQDELLVWYKF